MEDLMIDCRQIRIRVLLAGAMIFSFFGLAAAQDVPPNDYGISAVNYFFVSAEEFQPFLPNSVDWLDANVGGARYMDSPTSGMVSANVRLPSGALVTGMAVVYDDSDVNDGLWVHFERNWWGIGSHGGETIKSFNSSGTPGITRTYVDIDPDHTITYVVPPISVQAYRLVAWLDSGYLIQLRGVILYWRRQVSPAPATATFSDVPVGSFGFKHVEALAASGITAGCGGGSFCPDNTLTRVEMAVFLAKALGLHWAP
jgi:hypothetical protein